MGFTAFMIGLWAHFKQDIINVAYYKPDQEPVAGEVIQPKGGPTATILPSDSIKPPPISMHMG